MAPKMCMPLEKYSYALGEIAGRVPWTHVNGDGLCIVLNPSKDRTLLLLILHANTVLDSIDLTPHIDKALRLQQREGTMRIDQLPIFAISKHTMLALRCMQDGQARRVQVRFRSIQERQQVSDLLASHGMTIQDQSGNSSEPLGLGNGVARPNTAISNVHTNNFQKSSPFFPSDSQKSNSPVLRASGLEVGGLLARPGFLGHDSNAISHAMPPPRPCSGDQPVPLRRDSLPRPNTFQGWRSHTQPSEPSLKVATAATAERSSSILHLAATETFLQPVSGSNDSFDISGSQKPRLSSSDNESRAAPAFTTDSTERPITAASRGSIVSTLDLPPLQKPRLVKDPSTISSTNTNRPHSSNYQASDTFNPLLLTNRVGENQDKHSRQKVTGRFLEDSKHTLHGAPVSPPKVASPPAGAGPPRTVLNPNGLRGSKSYGVLDDLNVPIETETELAVAEKVSRTNDDANSSFSVHELSQTEPIARALSALNSSSRYEQAEVLDGYAAQTQEDRLGALDQFMIENLENPSFTTLCEDVENCWRKIALGL